MCYIVYLNNILIFFKNKEEHLKHLDKILLRLWRFALYVSEKKCSFFTKEVKYLGYIINGEGVAMDPLRVVAIREWPTLGSHKDLQIFLGFANFYCWFIKGYAHITRPLTDKFKGGKEGKHFGL